jgi:outer membrane lipopolysaccharide assembly protein LptE/RlpB
MRWYDEAGDWLPTPEERAQLQAEQAERRAEQLVARLRQLRVDPDAITE